MLFSTVNCISIEPTIALPVINLASVLSPYTPCRYNLVFNNISTSNLPTTRKVPVTLTKQPFSMPRSSENIHSQLDILQNKGWLREIVILFVTINSPKCTKSHLKSLGNWITTQGEHHFQLNKKHKLHVYPEDFYFILVPSSYKIFDSHKNSVKFAVLLFLPQNKVTSCYQKTIPLFPNFVCTTSGKDTILITPSNYPSKSEQHWVDQSMSDATSEILFTVALDKLNATRRFGVEQFDLLGCNKVLTEACFYPTGAYENRFILSEKRYR